LATGPGLREEESIFGDAEQIEGRVWTGCGEDGEGVGGRRGREEGGGRREEGGRREGGQAWDLHWVETRQQDLDSVRKSRFLVMQSKLKDEYGLDVEKMVKA
jgi:hypothetical protein